MTSKQFENLSLALILVLFLIAVWIYAEHPDWIMWILTAHK